MSLYGLSFSDDTDTTAANRTNTLTAYGLFLAEEGFAVSAPEVQEDFISIKGLDGGLDVSDSPQGFPTYKRRKLTARLYRAASPYKSDDAAAIMAMASTLQTAWGGRQVRIYTPDTAMYYWHGRPSFGFDIPGGYITLEADIFPYKLFAEMKGAYYTVTPSTDILSDIVNEQRYVIPTITVSAATVIRLRAGTASDSGEITLAAGTWNDPRLILYPGRNGLKAWTVSASSGTLDIEWKTGRL